jgi:RNA polymerase sigma-70 factor (ECF subfamily)
MPTTSINEDLAELKELPATMHNPEEDIINQQEYDKWLTNIEKLKDDYKAVAKMNLIENFGYKEIAEELDMPINTVKTKIRRAKAQLLKMMDYSDELL